MWTWISAAVALALQVGSPARPAPAPAAVAAPAACPATPAPLPPVLAGWANPIALAAGAAETLPVGKAARVRLLDAATVDYPVKDNRPVAPGSKGGLLTVRIAEPGRYRVALGAGAWIDLVRDHAAVRSAAHAHGPQCSPVRKMVDFVLQPGTYTLQLSGGTAPTLDVMVVRLAPL